jgi:hypothetical protein
MDLHSIPIKPIAVSLGKYQAAVKTLELIFGQFCCHRHHHDPGVVA